MPEWYDACGVDELGVAPVIREIAGQSIGFRLWEGRIFAVRNFCGHAGAPMAYGEIHPRMTSPAPGEPVVVDRENPEIRCPWHHWGYDLKTGACTAPVRRPRVRIYETRVEGDRLLVLV